MDFDWLIHKVDCSNDSTTNFNKQKGVILKIIIVLSLREYVRVFFRLMAEPALAVKMCMFECLGLKREEHSTMSSMLFIYYSLSIIREPYQKC